MKQLLAVLIIATLPSLARAQTPNDYQFRPVLHWQIVKATGQGLAGWAILPDVTQTQPLRALVVAGWLARDHQNWKEFMFGGIFGTDGSTAPVVNIRTYSQDKLMDLYTELQFRPDRALASIFITTPIWATLRGGFEAELVAGLDGSIKTVAGLGPRLSYKLPYLPLTIATTAFQNIHGDLVVRTYVVYKPGK